MAQITPTEYLSILDFALGQELGAVVETSNPKLLKQRIYQGRSLHPDSRYDELIIFAPASNDRLLIAKKSVELDP